MTRKNETRGRIYSNREEREVQIAVLRQFLTGSQEMLEKLPQMPLSLRQQRARDFVMPIWGMLPKEVDEVELGGIVVKREGERRKESSTRWNLNQIDNHGETLARRAKIKWTPVIKTLR